MNITSHTYTSILSEFMHECFLKYGVSSFEY